MDRRPGHGHPQPHRTDDVGAAVQFRDGLHPTPPECRPSQHRRPGVFKIAPFTCKASGSISSMHGHCRDGRRPSASSMTEGAARSVPPSNPDFSRSMDSRDARTVLAWHMAKCVSDPRDQFRPSEIENARSWRVGRRGHRMREIEPRGRHERDRLTRETVLRRRSTHVTGEPAGMGYCHCTSCRRGRPSSERVSRCGNRKRSRSPRCGQPRLVQQDVEQFSESGARPARTRDDRHPEWGLTERLRRRDPELPVPRLASHANYAETVLPMRDGLPKQEGPSEGTGRSGTIVAE